MSDRPISCKNRTFLRAICHRWILIRNNTNCVLYDSVNICIYVENKESSLPTHIDCFVFRPGINMQIPPHHTAVYWEYSLSSTKFAAFYAVISLRTKRLFNRLLHCGLLFWKRRMTNVWQWLSLISTTNQWFTMVIFIYVPCKRNISS